MDTVAELQTELNNEQSFVVVSEESTKATEETVEKVEEKAESTEETIEKVEENVEESIEEQAGEPDEDADVEVNEESDSEAEIDCKEESESDDDPVTTDQVEYNVIRVHHRYESFPPMMTHLMYLLLLLNLIRVLIELFGAPINCPCFPMSR